MSGVQTSGLGGFVAWLDEATSASAPTPATSALLRALALDREAARLEAEGRRLAAHVLAMRAAELRRTVAELAGGVRT